MSLIDEDYTGMIGHLFHEVDFVTIDVKKYNYAQELEDID